MSKRILVCGSLAFDTIAVFEGHFKDHILADNVQALSVSFLVPGLRKEYGGCAGNIAYNLNLLGAEPVPVGALGADGVEYVERFEDFGIDTDHMRVLKNFFSAQCYITTDLDGNQIASFHPGAMLADVADDIDTKGVVWGCVSPDAKEAMFAHAELLHSAGIPFVFDLGQAMPLFDGADLDRMLSLCTVLTANEYEADIISQRTGRSIEDIAQHLQAAIITQGAQGSLLYENGQVVEIAAIQVDKVVDPTGCGDAHRAGLLHGLTEGWSMYEAACLGNVMGSIKVESNGPQNHSASLDQIQDMLQSFYEIDKALDA